MILLTGASGFVGRAVFKAARDREIDIRPVLRSLDSLHRFSEAKSSGAVVAMLHADTDWGDILKGVDAVVHCAARVHQMSDNSFDPLLEFRKVNVAGTLNLANQAAQAGVRRFVFISSIKVNGEETQYGSAYAAKDIPAPSDAYGLSKCEAESGLMQLAGDVGMEVTIIRAPLIYGPRVKGNFLTMLRCLQRGVPLPLGWVTENRRSLVALDNLVDLLVTCIDHPAAANETFLVSDGEDLSTADLLCRLGNAMGKRARLLPVPPALLQAAAKLLGKGDMAQRLLGNLQVDISHTCQTLGWNPPIGVDEGLRRAVKGLNE